MKMATKLHEGKYGPCHLCEQEITKYTHLGGKWIAYPYKNGYVPHMCCAYGAVNAAHVQAALMCRICASYCHTSYMRSMYATCVRNMCCLHTCMLQVCCTSVSCMYACYNVLHICCLHTCKLLVFLICAACTHAYYYSAAYMPHTHM